MAEHAEAYGSELRTVGAGRQRTEQRARVKIRHKRTPSTITAQQRTEQRARVISPKQQAPAPLQHSLIDLVLWHVVSGS